MAIPIPFVVWHYILFSGLAFCGALVAVIVAFMEYQKHPSLGPEALGFDIARSCSISLSLFGASCFAAWWAPEILLRFSPGATAVKPSPWTVVSILSIVLGQVAFIIMRARAHLIDNHSTKG